MYKLRLIIFRFSIFWEVLRYLDLIKTELENSKMCCILFEEVIFEIAKDVERSVAGMLRSERCKSM